jgi:hypothetical protein
VIENVLFGPGLQQQQQQQQQQEEGAADISASDAGAADDSSVSSRGGGGGGSGHVMSLSKGDIPPFILLNRICLISVQDAMTAAFAVCSCRLPCFASRLSALFISCKTYAFFCCKTLQGGRTHVPVRRCSSPFSTTGFVCQCRLLCSARIAGRSG